MSNTRPLTRPILQKIADDHRSGSQPDMTGIGPDDGGMASNEEVGRLIDERYVRGVSTHFRGERVYIADELTTSGEELLRSLGGSP